MLEKCHTVKHSTNGKCTGVNYTDMRQTGVYYTAKSKRNVKVK